MKKTMRKVLAVCLVLALAFAGLTLRVDKAEAADDLTEKWVDVKFSQPMRVKWNWNDFLTNAQTADINKNLSVAGLVMSQAAEYSSAMVEGVLMQLGFSDCKSDYYLLSTDTKNAIEQPARTFAHKLLTKDGRQYHIICAVFKGTTTLSDAVTDINSVVDGFKKAGENCEASLESYVKSISGASKENTIMFITGHSLGASTANVVGLLSSGLVSDASKFVYTYASPNYKTNSAGEEKSDDFYKNFIRFTNADDAVPLVPPSNKLKHFGHLGRDVKYNLAGLDTETRAKFDRVYQYMTGKTFDKDENKIKNHLGDTYMSFILSDGLTNDQITEYLSPTATPAPGSTIAPGSTVAPGTTATPLPSTAPTASPVPTTTPDVATPPAVELQANPMTVNGKTAKVPYGKKKTLKVGKVLLVDDAEGTVTYAKQSGNKKITINKTTGKVTVKKGLKKGKIYKVKVKVTAAGNDEYKSKSLTRTFKIKIK